MIDLSGRVALVTGRVARHRPRHRAAPGGSGARWSSPRRAARTRRGTVEAIRAAGGKAEAVALDVTDAAAAEAAIAAALERHGRIDILVNNAGITRDQLMLRMKRDDWDAVLATNLTAAFALTQAVLKPMIRQRSGRIICISSVVGQSGNAGQANYAASKAGLDRLRQVGRARGRLAQHHGQRGRAGADRDRHDARDYRRRRARSWAARIPLGRLGTPDDVAAAVCFLASDEAAYITGQVLAVNGGMYM